MTPPSLAVLPLDRAGIDHLLRLEKVIPGIDRKAFAGSPCLVDPVLTTLLG